MGELRMAEAAAKANSMVQSRWVFISKKIALGVAMLFALTFAGCQTEDHRSLEEKATSPNPEFNSRYIMHCPRCGAPTAPYSINTEKSFYKCSGPGPRFTPHPEHKWSRRIDKKPESTEK